MGEKVERMKVGQPVQWAERSGRVRYGVVASADTVLVLVRHLDGEAFLIERDRVSPIG
jgi:hypothetical protein